MAEDDIIEFIRQKEKFVDQDYKFRYWTGKIFKFSAICTLLMRFKQLTGRCHIN